jgi:hypothetical protein
MNVEIGTEAAQFTEKEYINGIFDAVYRPGLRICSNLSCWIRIRIQIADPDPGGQKLPTKIEKSTEFSCFEVLDALF